MVRYQFCVLVLCVINGLEFSDKKYQNDRTPKCALDHGRPASV